MSDQINQIVENFQEELQRRNESFRTGKGDPEIKDKTVIITDDGIASGFTMLAAIRYIKKIGGYNQLIVAAPVSPQSSFNLIESEVDELICLHISQRSIFAVASFYEEWHDLSYNEVQYFLKLISEL